MRLTLAIAVHTLLPRTARTTPVSTRIVVALAKTTGTGLICGARATLAATAIRKACAKAVVASLACGTRATLATATVRLTGASPVAAGLPRGALAAGATAAVDGALAKAIHAVLVGGTASTISATGIGRALAEPVATGLVAGAAPTVTAASIRRALAKASVADFVVAAGTAVAPASVRLTTTKAVDAARLVVLARTAAVATSIGLTRAEPIGIAGPVARTATAAAAAGIVLAGTKAIGTAGLVVRTASARAPAGIRRALTESIGATRLVAGTLAAVASTRPFDATARPVETFFIVVATTAASPARAGLTGAGAFDAVLVVGTGAARAPAGVGFTAAKSTLAAKLSTRARSAAVATGVVLADAETIITTGLVRWARIAQTTAGVVGTDAEPLGVIAGLVCRTRVLAATSTAVGTALLARAIRRASTGGFRVRVTVVGAARGVVRVVRLRVVPGRRIALHASGRWRPVGRRRHAWIRVSCGRQRGRVSDAGDEEQRRRETSTPSDERSDLDFHGRLMKTRVDTNGRYTAARVWTRSHGSKTPRSTNPEVSSTVALLVARRRSPRHFDRGAPHFALACLWEASRIQKAPSSWERRQRSSECCSLETPSGPDAPRHAEETSTYREQSWQYELSVAEKRPVPRFTGTPAGTSSLASAFGRPRSLREILGPGPRPLREPPEHARSRCYADLSS